MAWTCCPVCRGLSVQFGLENASTLISSRLWVFRDYSRGTLMHQGKLVFSQIMMHLPLTTFRRCVATHRGDHTVKDFTCLYQFLAMAFAQLTSRESLRDIEVNLRAQAKRLYHMGFRCATMSLYIGQFYDKKFSHRNLTCRVRSIIPVSHWF